MALTAKQLAARKEVPASFVPALMAGDKDEIMSAWRRAVGDPAYVEKDLSMVWAPMFGSFIEPFALNWYAKKNHVKLSRRGEVVVHPNLPHVSCTMDAYDQETLTVIDCKAIGMWRKLDDVIQYYTPQVIVQRACIPDALRAALLIVHGGSEPELYPIDIDAAYEKEVWARIAQFWECVQTLTPPFEMGAALAPVIPVKTYEMTGNNQWAADATDWLNNREAAKAFADAATSIKGLVPADAIICHGHGIEVKRNRAGSLTIKSE